MREHRAAKRRKKLDRHVGKVNRAANKYNHDLDHVASVLKTGFRAFGGLSGFCEEFIKH